MAGVEEGSQAVEHTSEDAVLYQYHKQNEDR